MQSHGQQLQEVDFREEEVGAVDRMLQLIERKQTSQKVAIIHQQLRQTALVGEVALREMVGLEQERLR
jgi:hypothetical protein